MLQGTREDEDDIEDEDDVFVENLNTALFLFLGFLSVFASIILLVYSATAVFHGQQFLMSFLQTSVLAAFLFVIGLGALHLVGKRRTLRKRKKSTFFGISSKA